MNAIILSAGRGKRLKKYTKNIPKTMLKVNGKPILEHNIGLCKKIGINNIMINLHYLPNVITDYFGDGSDFGVKITYNKESDLLNTAGALLPFYELILNEPLFVIYGDNYISFNLLDLKRFHDQKMSDFSILLSYRNKVKNSGIVSLDKNNRIYKFIEKPNIPDSEYKLVNAGIYYFSPENIINHIYAKDDFGYDVFPRLIKNEFKLFGMKSNSNLYTIDTPKMYENVEQNFNNSIIDS